MAKFSKSSKDKLATCREELQVLFKEVVKGFDCTILQGYRGEEDQNRLFEQNRTKVKYPNSNHNKGPSLAVDVVPYPIDWKDRERFTYFAGYVIGIASQMKIKIRWGGDWNRDTEVNDNSFDDLPHFELID